MVCFSCESDHLNEDEVEIAGTNNHVFPETKSVVFITGFDEGDNRYYENARDFFQDKDIEIVEHLRSIAEILTWLNDVEEDRAFDEIHLVSHSNPWRGISLKIEPDGERITVESLAQYQQNHRLPKAGKAVNDETKIIIHACGLGNNSDLMLSLKELFSGAFKPRIYASPMYNVFGGKYASHYLAEVYYVFYPTAHSPGPMRLSKEIAENYPEVEIDWREALDSRVEDGFGDVYSYRFNIPVEWEFEFNHKNEVPNLTNADDIMDWISETDDISKALYEMNIPLEKYRWNAKVQGRTLVIKGKSTVICVMDPVLNQINGREYVVAEIEDPKLYTKM